MRRANGIISALLTSLVLLGMVVGTIVLALAEGNGISVPPSLTPAPTAPPPPTAPVLLSPSGIFPSPSPLPVLPTSTFTALPTASSCNTPAGWIGIIIQPGDTLASLALRYKISVQDLSAGNCLLNENIIPNTVLYVPAVPSPSPVPCKVRTDWVVYIIQPGDTLFHLAWRYSTTVPELQLGNCLGWSQYIQAGQRLYVPNVVTLTVSPTFPIPSSLTPTSTPTIIPVGTITVTLPPPTPSYTPSPSVTPIPPTATPTSTP